MGTLVGRKAGWATAVVARDDGTLCAGRHLSVIWDKCRNGDAIEATHSIAPQEKRTTGGRPEGATARDLSFVLSHSGAQ